MRFTRGLRLGFPIFLGYAPVGMAFGILADSLGFTPAQAILCSATALAGAGQFIGLALMQSQLTAAAVVAATAIVNLRYVLFGAAMSQYVSRIPVFGQALLAFSLTDETFAVNIDDHRRGTADAWSMAGVGAVAWTGWVAGTAIGAFFAGFIGDPSEWGVQFAMPAMFTALLVAQAQDRRHVVVAVIAASLTLALMLLLPGRWYVITTPIIAAALGAVIHR
ncbi:MAG: AzlC family ABC transporter permease [Coriobacteriia bacterium]|nr:AzlC family ABC transporter permease [Coriobacteriia bacterium]